jgi:soluble lytic murein transglycosylase
VSRRLLVVLVALSGVLVASAWVVRAEPPWYSRLVYPLRYQHIVRGHADRYRLDPALLAGVIYAESEFDARARSEAGAIGLMQLLPSTARGIAARTGGTKFVVDDLYDPELNVRYGAWYLRHLLDRYGDERTALAAYHAGQGNVDRWRAARTGIGFPETRSYVDRVLRFEHVYESAYADELGLD